MYFVKVEGCHSLIANASSLAMWRYSVIRQPEPLMIKVTTVDDMFCGRALFVRWNYS